METCGLDSKNNLRKNALLTADQAASDNWNRPYTREARRSRPSSRADCKFWPHVGRVNNVLATATRSARV